MKKVTYTCDECCLPIDGTSGPDKLNIFAQDLVELSVTCAMNNPMPEPKHYHRSCFYRVHDRIIAYGTKPSWTSDSKEKT